MSGANSYKTHRFVVHCEGRFSDFDIRFLKYGMDRV
jgi:hypothetical protein